MDREHETTGSGGNLPAVYVIGRNVQPSAAAFILSRRGPGDYLVTAYVVAGLFGTSTEAERASALVMVRAEAGEQRVERLGEVTSWPRIATRIFDPKPGLTPRENYTALRGVVRELLLMESDAKRRDIAEMNRSRPGGGSV